MKTSILDKKNLFALIIQNKEKINSFGVISLGVFGSFVRNEQNENSDIDLLVEFKDGEKTYKNFIRLVFYLEEIFGRKVELLTPKSISPYIQPYIMKEIEYVHFES